MTYTKGEGEQMGVLQKWWGPAHLLHPLSVWQSQETPVVWQWGQGSGTSHRGIEVVVVVATVKGEKRGNVLSEDFLGALGTVRAMAVGWLVCAHDACEGRCSRWLACLQRV